MAQIDEWASPSSGYANSGYVRDRIVREAWAWFKANRGKTFSVKVWFVTLEIPYSAVEFLWIEVFGPDPSLPHGRL